MKDTILLNMRWIFLLVLMYFLEQSQAWLNPGQDCSTLEKGPYYFKKIDDNTYQCVRDGPVYSCPEHWSIPAWYTYGHADPCQCQVVVTQGMSVCPEDPMFGMRTTENPISTTPVSGTINHNGCPSPFQKYEDTLRIYNTTDGKELKLTSSLGFLTSEDECKYHCLSIGTCSGVTYSVQDGVPICVGFFTSMARSYDLRGSDYHVYFEKVWCITDSHPLQPTPPPIQHGLLLQNTYQGGDSKFAKYAFLTGVKELSCYAWCYYEPSCAAVDYNKLTYECSYYTATSCQAHQPALDRCCNHYKKKVNACH